MRFVLQRVCDNQKEAKEYGEYHRTNKPNEQYVRYLSIGGKYLVYMRNIRRHRS